MTFVLTDALSDEILNALENQEATFVVDAKNSVLVSSIDERFISNKTSVKADENLYYSLPEWTSAEGYKLREDFTNGLHMPLAKDELQQVLHSGRGVFKNFRIILKKYPDVEKKWFLYKNRILKNYINDWYNDLRDIWGLEKLDYVPESDESLIHDDFSFVEYNPSTNNNEILQYVNAAFFKDYEADTSEQIHADLKSALYEMWQEQFLADYTEDNKSEFKTTKTGFICRSLSDDFAGCITVAPAAKNQEKIMKVTSLFVPENFRGLGIGTELLSMCLSKLKENGKTWIILPDNIVPEILRPLLARTGFEKIGTGFAARLQ